MTWPTARLGDVALVQGGRTPKSLDRWLADNPRSNRDIPFFKVGDMNAGPTLRHARTLLAQADFDELRLSAVAVGSVVFPKAGGAIATNKKRSVETEGPIDLNCMAVTPGPHLDERFLRLWFESFDLTTIADGSILPQISKRSASDLEIPLPPLGEQRRIVDLLEDHLSRLDAADQGLAISLAKLNGLRERTILYALTGADIPERVEMSLPDVGTSDGDLPSLPLGWEWARLGDVADVVGGITKDAKKQSDPSFVEVPYLRVANVQRGHLKLDVVTKIRTNTAKAKSLRLEDGDVLLNEGGDRDKLARGWVWEGQIPECIHQNHVFRARLHEPRLDPYFLSWTGNTFGGRWAERNGKQSVNLASISLRMIKQMPVIVPAAGDAEKVVASLRDQLDSYARLGSSLESARERGAALRRSLLAAAFSGRLTGRGSELSLVEEMIGA